MLCRVCFRDEKMHIRARCHNCSSILTFFVLFFSVSWFFSTFAINLSFQHFFVFLWREISFIWIVAFWLLTYGFRANEKNYAGTMHTAGVHTAQKTKWLFCISIFNGTNWKHWFVWLLFHVGWAVSSQINLSRNIFWWATIASSSDRIQFAVISHTYSFWPWFFIRIWRS